MGSTGAGPLVPTFHGFVSNSMDGLILFEACLSGKLHHVPRRPHDRERSSLIKSGSIFIYEENASGIKRWTDGVAWSPSRILGNFLIYRELEKPFPPGEKKRAMKRKRQSMPGEPYPRRESDDTGASDQITPITPPTPNMPGEPKSETATSDQDKEMERSLIGSLVDSYGFRPDGLVKKTMSISINGISHHMVSYYKVDDVKNNILPRPMSDPRLQGITVRPDLYLKQNFRAPVEETEGYAIDGNMHAHPQLMYQMPNGAYGGVRPGQYFGGHQYQAMYAMSGSTASPYTSTSASAWPTQQQTSGQTAYGAQQAYNPQGYAGYYQSATQQIKSEESSANSKPMSYSSHYPSGYAAMQQPRNGSQPTPTMSHSTYQTPVQQSPSSFAPMVSRPSYGNTTMPSPTTNGQSQTAYNTNAAQQAYTATSAQQYAVRSPTQNYHMQPAPHNAVPQSPNHLGKNEMAAPQGELAYRGTPYGVNTSQSGDRNPLHYY